MTNGQSARLTFADMFCGIGGFHVAASGLGMECVFACDIDPKARRAYVRNFGIEPRGDIAEIDPAAVPDHDLLTAGFPCQPFSIIGQMRGFKDTRGTLFFDLATVIDAKRPRALLLENVRQLSSHDKGRTLRRIMDVLDELGYAARWKILNALDFGLAQKRERTFIVGFRDGSTPFEWPQPLGDPPPLESALERDVPPKYFASDMIRTKRKAKHQSRYALSIWHENKGGNVSSHPFSCALRAGASYNYLLVNGERRLTPREMLRLQGFPEWFDLPGSYQQTRKQTGNAVPVAVVEAILRKMLDGLSKTETQGGLDQLHAISSRPDSGLRYPVNRKQHRLLDSGERQRYVG